MYGSFITLFLHLILIKYASSLGGTCGIEGIEPNDKVVGGSRVNYLKYPWFGILVLAKDPRKLSCGCSMINTKYCLTAAHCYAPFYDNVLNGKLTYEEIYYVGLGISNMCSMRNFSTYSKIKNVIIHEKYFHDKLYYDIALLLLDKEVKFSSFIPICLPPQNYSHSNLNGTIIGFGFESSNAVRTSCTLKEAVIPTQPDSVCKQMLKNQDEDPTLFQNAFCAGFPNGKIDTCQGDSGGPFQIKIKGKWSILGITSFGFSCAKPNNYGIYTNVAAYIDWIEKQIKKSSTTVHVLNSSTTVTNSSLSKLHVLKGTTSTNSLSSTIHVLNGSTTTTTNSPSFTTESLENHEPKNQKPVSRREKLLMLLKRALLKIKNIPKTLLNIIF